MRNMRMKRGKYCKEFLYLQINEVRRLIGPLSGKLALFCSDACIARYLRARNWNVKKAVKMLKASLKWRREYKPEEIRWVNPTSLRLIYDLHTSTDAVVVCLKNKFSHFSFFLGYAW